MPEIVQPEAVTVWYLKACCFCGWPEVVSDEYGRRYGNPAVCLERGKQKIGLLGERRFFLSSLQELREDRVHRHMTFAPAGLGGSVASTPPALRYRNPVLVP